MHRRAQRRPAFRVEAVGAGGGLVGEVGDVDFGHQAGEDEGEGPAQFGEAGADDAAVGFDDGPDGGGEGAPWGGVLVGGVWMGCEGVRGRTDRWGLGPWRIERGLWCGRCW